MPAAGIRTAVGGGQSGQRHVCAVERMVGVRHMLCLARASLCRMREGLYWSGRFCSGGALCVISESVANTHPLQSHPMAFRGTEWLCQHGGAAGPTRLRAVPLSYTVRGRLGATTAGWLFVIVFLQVV